MLGGGWQSGLLTAGGQGVAQPKPAYAALASDFGAGRAACKGPLVSWTPLGVSPTGGTVKSGKKPVLKTKPKSHGKAKHKVTHKVKSTKRH